MWQNGNRYMNSQPGKSMFIARRIVLCIVILDRTGRFSLRRNKVTDM